MVYGCMMQMDRFAFAGSDIDQFELYNSYVTGFNGANSIRYSDTDGTKSNGWVIDGNLIGGVTGGVGWFALFNWFRTLSHRR